MKRFNLPWLRNIEAIVEEKGTSLSDTITVTRPAKTKVKRVAGFVVSTKEIPETTKETANVLKKNFNAMRSKRDTFEAALNSSGLKPIAILPKKVWDEICRQTKLIRFEHFEKNGKVQGNSENLTYRARTVFRIAVVLALGLIEACVLGIVLFQTNPNGGTIGELVLFCSTLLFPYALTVFFIDLSTDRKFIRNSLLSLAGSALWLACVLRFLDPGANSFALIAEYTGYLMIMVFFPLVLNWIVLSSLSVEILGRTRATSLGLRLLSMSQIIKLLWKEGKDEFDRYDLLVSVTPLMPEPPQDFMDKLVAVESAGIASRACVAIEPKALRVDRKELIGKMPDMIRKIVTKEDPIVYVKNHEEDLVAVIAQFGKFSNEKKAIELAEKMNPDQMF